MVCKHWLGCFYLGAMIQVLPVVETLADSYQLVWSDEFTGDQLDLSKWSYRRLGPRVKGINVKEAIQLDGMGHLLITTRQVGEQYHTGMIGTEDKLETRFGYFETRVRLQTQEGHWSAFWLQSPLIEEPGPPTTQGVEVDVFEYHSRNHFLNRALHWGGYGLRHRQIRYPQEAPELATGYHTFGVEWTPDHYIFYVNGEPTWQVKDPISQIPQYMILSLEVGPWAGSIQKATLPDRLWVDYVRVFKKLD